MKNIELMTSALTEFMTISQKLKSLVTRVEIIEKDYCQSIASRDEKWMSLKEAANILNKTPDAIRQRLKHPKKPMPEGVVWKQESKGCEIYLHLGNYRKYK